MEEEGGTTGVTGVEAPSSLLLRREFAAPRMGNVARERREKGGRSLAFAPPPSLPFTYVASPPLSLSLVVLPW